MIPRAHVPSRYDKKWEPYIAANIYLYAVPLAIFLHRARELDFSKHNFDKSVELVRSVFRVFSPAVVDAMCRHLNPLQSEYSGLIRYHANVLGDYAPTHGVMTMSSLQDDTQALLEEIDMQHKKRLREEDMMDWIISKVEKLGRTGEARNVDVVIKQARIVATFPTDYNFFPQDRLQTSSSRSILLRKPYDSSGPERSNEGTLTEQGKMQVLEGSVQCHPYHIAYVGDVMLANVGEHELSILVTLAILASDSLKERSGVRCNFRFFADYRNTFFCSVVLWIVLKLLL